MHATKCRRLRRTEASAYLREEWGVVRAPSTLAKLACIGGGPRFESANRTPLYREEELDASAQSVLSPLKSSTSDKRGDTNVTPQARKVRALNANANGKSCETSALNSPDEPGRLQTGRL